MQEASSQITINNKAISIKPTFTPPSEDIKSFSIYLESVKEKIIRILPKNIVEAIKNVNSPEEIKDPFLLLNQTLPILSHSHINEQSTSFSFTCLFFSEFSHGVGRFIADMLSRWLIPGKELGIQCMKSLGFTFEKFTHNTYFFAEYIIDISNAKDLVTIKKNLSQFLEELNINILSVYHARYVISKKQLSIGQQSAIIQDNIASLLYKKTKHFSAFDKMQDFLIKVSAEKKLSQIKENITRLMSKKPNTFDTDIFTSVHYVSLLFQGNFTGIRDPKYISRIIAFYYLFQKVIKQASYDSPNTRHISCKIFKTKLTTQPNTIIGVLVTINLINETDHFEKEHVLDGIKHCITNVEYIDKSYIVDLRSEKIRSYYIEVEKTDKKNFLIEEIIELREKLPAELKNRITNTLHPIFMPRNEEEILRNIVLLSKQLKYVNDIPQVIITYEKQTATQISFMVILVRLLKINTLPLKEYFSYSDTFLQFSHDEVKTIGQLKKKYPKEANIFKLSVKKSLFFRKDHSIDLQKARQAISTELFHIIGAFRDFNGGMILKQSETFNTLKKNLESLEKKYENVLESYFHSIKPGTMKSIISSETLRNHFSLLLDILRNKYTKRSPYLIKTILLDKYFLIQIGMTSTHKEKILAAVSKLTIASFDLTSTSYKTPYVETLGYIFRYTKPQQYQKLLLAIEKTFE